MNRLGPPLLALLLLTAFSIALAQLSGVVEIEMRTEGTEVFFDPVGVWVEPGTTIRFILVDGVHDSQAYHPDNATDLMRIPEGAEPWNSGMLGGIIDTTGTFEVTLTVEGVYDYFCSPHHALGMVGRIVVGDPDASPAKPDDELPYEAARDALPSVERILAEGAVYHQDGTEPRRQPTEALGGELRDVVAGDLLGAWSGGENAITESFHAGGRWELTLGAWCFEGIGFVRAQVFGEDGEAIGEVLVRGEGIESVVFDTPPGLYYLAVTVSHSHIYSWELAATDVDELEPGASDDGDPAPAPAGTTALQIPQQWQGDDFFTTEPFEAGGEWEVVFGAWCHDGVSFVRATVRDHDGTEIEDIMVIGEGVQSRLLTTDPAVYTVEIWSPNMADYHWELVVRPADAQ
jgi:plastocyanin